MSQSALLVCSIDLHHGQCAQIDGATVAVCTLLAHFTPLFMIHYVLA